MQATSIRADEIVRSINIFVSQTRIKKILRLRERTTREKAD